MKALTVVSTLYGTHRVDQPARTTPLFSLFLRAPPVDIEAPAALVWSVISDFVAYPEWNPLNRGVEVAEPGGLGAPVHLSVSWGPYVRHGDGFTMDGLSVDLQNDERLTIWEVGRCLAYGDDYGFLHRAERVQLLEPLGPNRTRYHNVETMVGLLSPFVHILGGKIERGFAAASIALKARAEAIHKEQLAQA